jgi:hypothetical protein
MYNNIINECNYSSFMYMLNIFIGFLVLVNINSNKYVYEKIYLIIITRIIFLILINPKLTSEMLLSTSFSKILL